MVEVTVFKQDKLAGGWMPRMPGSQLSPGRSHGVIVQELEPRVSGSQQK